MSEVKEAAPEAVEAVEAPKEESVNLEAEAKLAAAGLDKFKDVGQLAKSYAELEKKFHDSRLPKNADSDTLLAKTKDFYGNYESKSVLTGELGEWSKELSERTGLPAQMVDLITAKVASKAMASQAEARKAEVRQLLEDKTTLARINNALSEKGDAYELDLSTRIQKGHVTAAELKALAELGMKGEESGQPIEKEAAVSEVGAEQELMAILNNRMHPFYNPGHNDHYSAVARVDQLKKVLNF